MIALDTNVLIYAHRRESNRHKIALGKITVIAEGEAPWALPVFCLAEFVRVVTHLRVFDPPTPLPDALRFLTQLMLSPSVRLLLPTPNYASTFNSVCTSAGVRGNLAFDAQIAAVCREHGIDQLLTADKDFARFKNLRIIGLED
ncbi:MAG: PIN domain-containing protein [Pseudomonadota bacterium]|nr:PIN domain-containing protein [Pseudomonadota bacterium]